MLLVLVFIILFTIMLVFIILPRNSQAYMCSELISLATDGGRGDTVRFRINSAACGLTAKLHRAMTEKTKNLVSEAVQP